jgi:hypothetical protein
MHFPLEYYISDDEKSICFKTLVYWAEGWGGSSSGRVPAWQAQDPEFKAQYRQKTKQNKKCVPIKGS